MRKQFWTMFDEQTYLRHHSGDVWGAWWLKWMAKHQMEEGNAPTPAQLYRWAEELMERPADE